MSDASSHRGIGGHSAQPPSVSELGEDRALDQPGRGRARLAFLGFGLSTAVFAAASSSADPAVPERVAALGRLEPRRGVYHLAGPPRPAVVIETLEVEEGDRVERGRVIAVLQGIALARAEIARFRAEVVHAEHEFARSEQLRRGAAASEVKFEEARRARVVARAHLAHAEADLELSRVRAPIDGQVLKIHAREGERVGPDGILEIGDTAAMYAVAEVYEMDVGRVRVGQRAEIRSPALGRRLAGSVERVGLRIGKQDVLGTDPVADADARVVEVEVRLDDPAPAARLTNLRVEVLFEP
jgi:multidrug efflux pump subunit AcrA (membrane-fusion protein)